MPGIKMRPAPRKLGAIVWDMLPVYEVRWPPDDIESIWDYVSEYRFLRTRTGRWPKTGLPGPYGITTELDFSPVYRYRSDCAEALVLAIRRDIQNLVAADCDYIQTEEPLTPSRAAEDRTAENLTELANKAVDGISGCTFVVPICFGSFRRLPYAMRIKMHYPETPEDILERVRTCLEDQDPERLEISTRLRPAPGSPLPGGKQDVRGGRGRPPPARQRLNGHWLTGRDATARSE